MNIKQLEKKILKAISYERYYMNKYYDRYTKDNIDRNMTELKLFVEDCFKDHVNGID